ncbi:metallo-beta-lactamase [Yersinia pestis S3]|nr:metallo-beta-lactamase [Yersinia pestis S3]
MAKITTFEVGYCTHLACMALKGAPFRVCKFPARACLIEVDGHRWLWDTGYATWFEQYTQSGVFRLYRQVTPVYFDPAQSLVTQLREQGYVNRDIHGLILSHFHADHIAGLRDFSDLTFICSGDGWHKTRELRGVAALRQAFIPGLIPESFESSLQFIESVSHSRCYRLNLPPLRAVSPCPAAKGRSFWCRYRAMRWGILGHLFLRIMAGSCWQVTRPGHR